MLRLRLIVWWIVLLGWALPSTNGWFRYPHQQYGFRSLDSASKPVTFQCYSTRLCYLTVAPLSYGSSRGQVRCAAFLVFFIRRPSLPQALVPLYLEYHTADWMDDAPSLYFDGNETANFPTWAYSLVSIRSR